MGLFASPGKQFLIGGFLFLTIVLGMWTAIIFFFGIIPTFSNFLGLVLPGILLGLGMLLWGFLVFRQYPGHLRSGGLPKQKERESGLVERDFQKILETVDLVPWEADLWTWRFLYVGPQAESLLGFPVAAWYEESFWTNRIHFLDRERVMERCRWACSHRLAVRIDYRMTHSQGHVIWVQDLITVPKTLSGSKVFRGCLVDITARKQAEEALAESEERFRKIFELGQIGMAISSPDKQWLKVNDRLCQIVGYTREELLAKTWAEITHPEDLKEGVEFFEQVLARKIERYTLDKRYIRKDGSIIYVTLSVQCMWKEEGSVDYFLALIQDITERKKALEALSESEERFRSVVESSIQGILIHQDFRVLYANPAAAHIFGYANAQEMVGMDLRSSIVQEFFPEIQKRTSQLQKGNPVPIHSGWQALRRDGQAIWISSGAKTINWKGQVAVLASLLDITYSKQAEDALRMSEKRFRDLFNSSPDAIFVEDLRGMVLDANPMACKLHRMSMEELIGKDVRDLVPASERNRVASDFSHLKEGETVQLEGHSLTYDGQEIPVEIRASLIEYEKEPAVLLHVRDITLRKELEKKLLQVEKMQAIARVAGNTAHDFNNILFAIGGYADTLQTHPLPLEARQEVEEINKAVERAKNLARQLLVYRGNESVDLQLLDLNSFLVNREKLVLTVVPEAIDFRFCLGPLTGGIQADPERLERALLNLVRNAIDSMPQGGQLTIATKEVFLDDVYCRTHLDAQPGNYIQLLVQDTGSGMTDEVRTRAFEPFFSTKGDKGTGLGLYSVYGIVKQMSGHIDLQSVPHHGTTFSLYFPKDRSGEKKTESIPASISGSSKEIPPFAATKSILVVDDETMVRPVYRRLLEAEGYLVWEADSGPEALEVWDKLEKPTDLLITDIIMPKMNGFELSQILRKKHPSLKVLYVTGFFDPQQWDFLREIPLDFLLQKPFLPEIMLEKVRILLE